MPDYVWYASYGSNMHADRLNFYVEGGTPPGTSHVYPGMRDRTPPLKTRGIMLPGSVYFAWESPVWTGGVAFYAPEPAPGWVTGAAARGYLLTAGQFADLQAQEMYREPGGELDLTEVLRTGRSQLGPGRYETLVYADALDGWPVLTFTSPWNPPTVKLNKPSARYLQRLTTGLHESHNWDGPRIRRYLAELPGIQGRWDGGELGALVEEALKTAGA